MLVSVALCEYHKSDEDFIFLEMAGQGQQKIKMLYWDLWILASLALK